MLYPGNGHPPRLSVGLCLLRTSAVYDPVCSEENLVAHCWSAQFPLPAGLGDRCLYRRFRCSACDAVLFSVAVGFFFCGAGFGFGGGLLSFRRSRTVSSRSLFFFLSSSRIAGRSSFGIEASATICSSVALICPVRISSCAPGTASSAASMPREYFSARRTVADPTPCSTAIRSQVRFSESM